MTTAARPTWAPAKGGHEQGGVRMFGASQKYSSRDLASHTNLKLRFVCLTLRDRNRTSRAEFVTEFEIFEDGYLPCCCQFGITVPLRFLCSLPVLHSSDVCRCDLGASLVLQLKRS